MDHIGTEVGLEHHCGRYTQAGEEEEPAKDATKRGFGHYADGSRTIWWSHIVYDHHAERLELPTVAELAAIEID